jgi:hypothetical protein
VKVNELLSHAMSVSPRTSPSPLRPGLYTIHPSSRALSLASFEARVSSRVASIALAAFCKCAAENLGSVDLMILRVTAFF